MQIYLDHSATTPPRPEVITRVQEILTTQWGNPSSLHHWGERASRSIEIARLQVAQFLNSPDIDSIIFTSSGTESDNFAILGITQRYDQPQHIITSLIEHSAIAQTLNRLETQGWRVTRLGVDRTGKIAESALKSAIREDTVLISLIYGQSEIGTVQSIEQLGQIARDHGIPFHTDAVQVAGKLPLDVQKLPIDLLSLSGHKIYGVQGAGVLYCRPELELQPLLRGGGQEFGLRSGTQAVANIAGMGVACQLAQEELETETPRLIILRDRLFALLADCPFLQVTGHPSDRLPHHLSFCLREDLIERGITGKTLVRQLNLAGIGISAGSACHSGKLSPSPILLAMGYSSRSALGGIRLTLGKMTTLEDIEWTAQVIKCLLQQLLISVKG